MELNNRELALLIWLGIGVVFLASRRDMRPAFKGVLVATFKPVIVVPLLCFAAWVVGLAYLAAQVGLWQDELVNDTVLWFFASGVVLFFNIERVFAQDDFFQRTALATLKVGLLIEVFVNFVVMPFPVEFVLLPVITLLTMMSAVAATKDEYAPARRLVERILMITGLALLAYVGVSLIADPGRLGPDYGLRALALPVWLTFGSLPFIYLVGLYAAYDKTFTMLDFHAKKPQASRRSKLALLTKLHLRARMVGAFNAPWQHDLLAAQTAGAARQVVGNFVREQRHAPDGVEDLAAGS